MVVIEQAATTEDRERDKMGIQTVVDNASSICHARIMPSLLLENHLS